MFEEDDIGARLLVATSAILPLKRLFVFKNSAADT